MLSRDGTRSSTTKELESPRRSVIEVVNESVVVETGPMTTPVHPVEVTAVSSETRGNVDGIARSQLQMTSVTMIATAGDIIESNRHMARMTSLRSALETRSMKSARDPLRQMILGDLTTAAGTIVIRRSAVIATRIGIEKGTEKATMITAGNLVIALVEIGTMTGSMIVTERKTRTVVKIARGIAEIAIEIVTGTGTGTETETIVTAVEGLLLSLPHLWSPKRKISTHQLGHVRQVLPTAERGSKSGAPT